MRIKAAGRTAAMAVTILAAVQAFSANGEAAAFDNPTHDEINNAFGVFESDLQFIDLGGARPGEPVTVFMELEGEGIVLDLHPFSNRAAEYRVLKQTAGGALGEVEPGPLRTLRGDIVGLPTSSASGSLREYGLEAHVSLMPGVDYWIDPVVRLFPGADPDLYVVFRSDQAMPMNARCGNDDGDFRPPLAERGFEPDIMRSGGVTIHIAEIACDADYEYYTSLGSDVGAVEDEINAILNTMNEQYERDVAIRHEINTIIVRADSDDPYTETGASAMLAELRAHWNANHGGIGRDVVQLFTGKNIDGSTIGIAYVGVICNTAWAYGLVEPGARGMNCKTDLSAHELGHNWSADHCTCPSHTMNPSLRCANIFHPTETVPEIVAHRDSRACLTTEETPAVPTLDSYDILQGSRSAGDLTSLEDSDNDRLLINSTGSGKRRRSKTVINMTSPCTDLISLDLTVETGATRGGIVSRVQLYDYLAGRWRLIERFEQTRGDLARSWDVENPDRFVRDSDGRMRVRLTTVLRDKTYRVKVDQVRMVVE